MASAAIPKRIVGAQPHGDSPRGIIPIRSYRNAEHIVSYQSDRSHRSDHQSIHRRERTFVVRAISEIPELSHGIQDRRPRHSKHPSLLAMPTVFPAFSITLVGRFPELTPVRSQTTSRGFLPWMLVTTLLVSVRVCFPFKHGSQGAVGNSLSVNSIPVTIPFRSICSTVLWLRCPSHLCQISRL